MHPIADVWQPGFLFFLRFLAFANILLVYLFNSFKSFNTFSRQKTFTYQSLKSIHVSSNRKTSERKRAGPWVNTGKRVCCNGLMREWIHDSGFWKVPRGEGVKNVTRSKLSRCQIQWPLGYMWAFTGTLYADQSDRGGGLKAFTWAFTGNTITVKD